jgi:hypothetical protein
MPKFGLFFGFLVSLGITSVLLLYSSELTPAERARRLPRWVGCYRLYLGPWSDGLDASQHPYAPPPTFRLDTTVRRSPLGIPLGFMSTTPESPNARHPGAYPPGWDLLSRDSAQVFWSDGFHGIELRLGYGTRTGLAQATSDVIDPFREPPRALARATPVRCEPGSL